MPLPRAVSTAAATSAVPMPSRCRSGYDRQRAQHPHLDQRRGGRRPSAWLSPTWPTTTPPLLGDEAGPPVPARGSPRSRRRRSPWSPGRRRRRRRRPPGVRPHGRRAARDAPRNSWSRTLPRLRTVPPWRLPRWPTAPTSRCSSGREARSPTAAPTWSSARPTTRRSGGATSCCSPRRRRRRGGAAEWLREFEREFPEARHRTFGDRRHRRQRRRPRGLHRARPGGRGVERDDRRGGARAAAAQHRGDVPAAGLRRRLGPADRGGPGRRGRRLRPALRDREDARPSGASSRRGTARGGARSRATGCWRRWGCSRPRRGWPASSR